MKTSNGITDNLERVFEELLTVQNDKLAKLDKLFHLLEELTEITDHTVAWLIAYCDRYNISLCQEKQLTEYIKLSKLVMAEIGKTSTELESTIKLQKVPFSELPNDFSQRKRPNRDFTIPMTGFW